VSGGEVCLKIDVISRGERVRRGFWRCGSERKFHIPYSLLLAHLRSGTKFH